MGIIRENKLRKEVEEFGAIATATRLKEALEDGTLTTSDFPSIRMLYELFVTEKNKDKQACGHHVLREEMLSEEAGSLTSIDAFSVVASQLFFNALVSVYSAADFNVAPEFRVIPSSLTRGEQFAGISNLNTVLSETPRGKPLPSLEPTQDFAMSPPMRQKGACVDITLDLMKADRTGEITQMFEKLGQAIATDREIEACSTLTGYNGEIAAGGTYTRSQYNWKNTPYATYQSSTPWVNVITSNDLVNYDSINAAYLKLTNMLDPFTGYPLATPPGRLKLICCPERAYIAERLKAGIQYRTSAGGNSPISPSTDQTPLVVTDARPPVEFDVISSKYLRYVLNANSVALSNWYLGYMRDAFSWQQFFPLTVAEALPNAGDMFRRNLAASYKAFRDESSFVFNPRYTTQNSA